MRLADANGVCVDFAVAALSCELDGISSGSSDHLPNV